MTKQNVNSESSDALDHVDFTWLGDYYVFEEGTPVSIEVVRKTKFGLWKNVIATTPKEPSDNDPYAQGRSLTCVKCNTSYNTNLRRPRCPYCHTMPS